MMRPTSLNMYILPERRGGSSILEISGLGWKISESPKNIKIHSVPVEQEEDHCTEFGVGISCEEERDRQHKTRSVIEKESIIPNWSTEGQL
jgi:hypothetical protein